MYYKKRFTIPGNFRHRFQIYDGWSIQRGPSTPDFWYSTDLAFSPELVEFLSSLEPLGIQGCESPYRIHYDERKYKVDKLTGSPMPAVVYIDFVRSSDATQFKLSFRGKDISMRDLIVVAHTSFHHQRMKL